MKSNGLVHLTKSYEAQCGILGETHPLIAAMRGKLARMEANFERGRGMAEFENLTCEVNQLLQMCIQERGVRERPRESG